MSTGMWSTEVKTGRPVRNQGKRSWARAEVVEMVRSGHRFWSILKVKVKDLTIGSSNSTPRCIHKRTEKRFSNISLYHHQKVYK